MPKTTIPPPLVDIIFLDIDGVLLPFGDNSHILGGGGDLHQTYTSGCIFPDSTMEALSTLLMTLDDMRLRGMMMNAKIVLSSSWRSHQKLVRDILTSFQSFAKSRAARDKKISMVLENTFSCGSEGYEFFDVTDTKYHSTRHDEIINWIECAKTNGASEFLIRSWIALDDEDIVTVEGRKMNDSIGHAVQTLSTVGLTLREVNVAIRLLEKQVQEYSR